MLSDVLVRIIALVLGLALAAGSFAKAASIGPAFSRGPTGHRPLTRGQRAVIFVFGCALVVGGILG